MGRGHFHISNIRHLSSSPQTRQSCSPATIPYVDVGTGRLSRNQLHRKVQYLNFSLLLHCNVFCLKRVSFVQELTTRLRKYWDEPVAAQPCLAESVCVESYKISTERVLPHRVMQYSGSFIVKLSQVF